MSVSWRTLKSCDNCPFAEDGEGRRLRRSLRPGRWREILASLRRGQVFHCHKTIDYGKPEDRTSAQRLQEGELICAGALDWQRRNQCVPAAVQVAARLEAMKKGTKSPF